MKAWVIGASVLRQQRRDVVGLALTLLTAPAFVGVYGVVFQGEAPGLRLGIVGPVEAGSPSAALVEGMEAATGEVEVFEARAEGEAAARGGEVDAVVVAAPGWDDGGRLVVLGDASAPGFAGGAAIVAEIAQELGHRRRGSSPPVAVAREGLGRSLGRSAFEGYVPSLLVFSCIMLVFSTAMTVAREVERGTLERLRLTAMRPVDYLVGVAGAQAVLGSVGVALTFAAAAALGFEAAGSLAAAGGVVGALALACVGIGVAVGGASRTVARAFLLSSVAMFGLMLFSGMVFPLPSGVLQEVLPTALAARALHRVLALGAGWGEIAGELGRLAGVSAGCFVAGALAFGWMQRVRARRGGEESR